MAPGHHGCAVAHVERLRLALRRLEWVEGWCPRCEYHRNAGHSPDCYLAALLHESKPGV
jgi:hypothetical protein